MAARRGCLCHQQHTDLGARQEVRLHCRERRGGGILAVYGSFVANITVLLEAVAPEQTSFRINVTGKVFYKDNPDGSKRDPATKQCQSTGGFETTFLDSLRQ